MPQILSSIQHIFPRTQFGGHNSKGHLCSPQLHKIAVVIMNIYKTEQDCVILFLVTEKTSDKAWNDGLLYKMKNQYRIVQPYLLYGKFAVRCYGFTSQS